MSGKSRASVAAEQLREELLPNQSIALLQELHILTRDGQLNADSRRKLKQVNHLYRMLEPFLVQGFEKSERPVLVDLGAGKSYLGFILYDLFFRPRDRGAILAVENRSELIAKGEATAARLGFERMKFVAANIDSAAAETAVPESTVTWTTALHACDCATDDAIDFALEKRSDYIALVPCCQASIAQALKNSGAEKDALWSHPLHRREFGSHLTNVLRCLRLEAAGYKVTVTELVGWEHSLKNELILAERKGEPLPEKRAELESALEKFPLGEAWKKRFLRLR